MTKHDLSPAYVECFYHSLKGRHVATLPTRAWNELGGTRGGGGYLSWSGANADALDMIDDYVAHLADFLHTSSTIDSAIIFTKADAASPAVPRFAYPIAVAGGNTISSYPDAVQQTFTFFDENFLPFKAVILDAVEEYNFTRINAGDFVTKNLDFAAVFTNDLWAWSSRAGGQITLPRARTATLNEKLRRAYRLT